MISRKGLHDAARAPTTAPHVKVVCRNCKGDSVSMDATAIWSIEKQDWVLSGVMDTAYCDNCDETQLDEVPLPAEGATQS